MVEAYPLSNIIEFLNRFSIRIDQEKYLDAYKKARCNFISKARIDEKENIVRTAHYNIITKEIDYLHFTITNLLKMIENYQKYNYEFQLKYIDIEKRVKKKLQLNTHPTSPLLPYLERAKRQSIDDINDFARVTFISFAKKHQNFTPIKPTHEELYGLIFSYIRDNHAQVDIITTDLFMDLEEMDILYRRNLSSINNLANDIKRINFDGCYKKLELVYRKRLINF